MAHRFGFFDADCRELAENGRGLAYRLRVGPIVPQLKQLYALAEARAYPLVFTTCCSGRMLSPPGLPGIGFVPLDAADASWRATTGNFRQFYLAKHTCGQPKANFDCRAFDMFQYNANASRLLRELGVETWVVFGNGFDLCVGAAARGILQAGLELILLEDVRISSAGATSESEQRTFSTLRHLGARLMTLQSFMHLVNQP